MLSCDGTSPGLYRFCRSCVAPAPCRSCVGGWCTLAVILSLLSNAAPAPAALQGDPELLRQAALAMRSNRERLLTWQGTARSESYSALNDGVSAIATKSDASFAYDRVRDSKRWNLNNSREQNIAGPGAPPTHTKTTDIVNEMKKGGVFYYYSGGYIRDGKIENALVIDTPSRQGDDNLGYNSIDPTWYFTLEGRDLVEMLLFHQENANLKEMSPGTISRDGSRVILETRIGDATNRYQFDLAAGGNLTSFDAEDSGVAVHTELSYEQQHEVWVPKTFSTVRSRKVGGVKTLETSRKATFVSQSINEPLDASAFSLEALGVKIGDPVSDHRVGMSYRYGGGKEVERVSGLSTTPVSALVAEPAVKPRPVTDAPRAISAVEAPTDSPGGTTPGGLAKTTEGALHGGPWVRLAGAFLILVSLVAGIHLFRRRKPASR